MAEQKIQRSGLTDPNSIKAIGQATNAQFVLSGDVRSLGSINIFVASILKIEDGSLINGDPKNYRTIEDGLQLMAELARTLTANMPGTGSPAIAVMPDPEPMPKTPSSDFSTGRKIGAGFLNLAFGTGSFIMGDWSGGLTLLAGHAVGWTLIGVELGSLKYEDALAGWLGPIGVGVVGISAVYGFIRPFIYHKSTGITLVDLLDRVHIVIIPVSSIEIGGIGPTVRGSPLDTAGIKAIGLSYSFYY
jgi:hypothetical protein